MLDNVLADDLETECLWTGDWSDEGSLYCGKELGIEHKVCVCFISMELSEGKASFQSISVTVTALLLSCRQTLTPLSPFKTWATLKTSQRSPSSMLIARSPVSPATGSTHQAESLIAT